MLHSVSTLINQLAFYHPGCFFTLNVLCISAHKKKIGGVISINWSGNTWPIHLNNRQLSTNKIPVCFHLTIHILFSCLVFSPFTSCSLLPSPPLLSCHHHLLLSPSPGEAPQLVPPLSAKKKKK